ncbi:glycoside hydrolase family 3 protein [Coniophora puteana RWD-64-598 SS2]|uniref:beta-glucosidase n=1 Tax=Coniophora puteana (strain RWD-64-598) TaxID=741705 RepID=A0A5M3M7N0_CONPW|nr:glycoside hydrolase family 3 protein [Coniophora puteana RWD-64-598 SS2]EIW74780.1 glycoside hydrolase family 3 protein [Coniophora puteana RWD-64-598 SS2]
MGLLALSSLLLLLPFAVGQTTTSVSLPSGVTVTGGTTFSSPTTYLATETGALTNPISYYSFTAFPTPSTTPDPPVYPPTDPLDPPPVSQDPTIVPDFAAAWATAHAKARQLLSNFTLLDKVNLTTGIAGRCVGNIGAVGDFPGLCLEDSPTGVRYTDLVTSFPAGITTASTWNRALMRTRGQYIGEEFKGKGAHIALGPMMNMGRNPQGGRNWEGFGADPFLSGESAYETVLGMQSGGVQAVAKHYVNNEQEWKRTMESSNVDDRTEHEIYTHPFMRAVMAGVSSVMCSYNLINDTYACNNNKTLNDIMKREFGFQGYIQSDWWATMDTLGIINGLDMTMPGTVSSSDAVQGQSYFGGNLTTYVMNGTISPERLDDMAERIVASWYYMHQDEGYPPVSFDMNDPWNATTNLHVNVQANHSTVVRTIGAAGAVLLKNENNALPLDKPRSIALVGSDAGPPVMGPNQYADQGGDPTGILAMGWGSGWPYEAIQARAREDQTSVYWDFDNWDLWQAGNRVTDQSVAIVFVNSDSGEGYIYVDGNYGDRKNLTAWHGGDELIQTVAANNNNTIVVINSVGPLILEPWIENPNVTAVLWASLGGNEAGNSITDVLYGDWNPSGKLPYTIAKNVTDYPAHVITGGTVEDILSINYTEGLFIDYRWFDAHDIMPRFEFGYGLSYTTFEFSDLTITPVSPMDTADMTLVNNWENGGASPIAEGSSTALWLHMPAYQVTFNITNTGSVYGGEIAQLYLHHPAEVGEPPSVLKGFTDVWAAPGETATGSITLSRHELSVWDVVRQGWAKPDGTITFSVGASSRDFRLNGTIPAAA